MLLSNPSPVLPITFSQSALAYIRKKLSGRPIGEGLRLGKKKSGCSGWLYTFDYGKQTDSDEIAFLVEPGTTLFIHRDNLKFFQGSLIDYVRSGLNTNLVCINPNEGARCGCGESFSLAEPAE